MPNKDTFTYRGNVNLKRPGTKIAWTNEMISEWMKCKEDIFYFIEKYYKIVTEDGLVTMIPRDYQVELIESMRDNRFTLAVMSRQCGKSEACRAFLLHYILFNDFKTVAIVADKAPTALEILSKLQLSYQNLPMWLQHGIIEFNKGSFVLENNSRIIATATSDNSLRGFTIHVLMVDEAAHVEHWDDFYSAIRPTISAGKETKIVLISTPRGMNHFYNFYAGSSIGSWKNKNGFHGIFVPWWHVPGRDENWASTELASMNFDQERFDREYACTFVGSSGTLISGPTLRKLKEEIEKIEPKSIFDDGLLRMYDYPVKEELSYDEISRQQIMKVKPHIYAITADVSRGKKLDYSGFSVFDITEKPFVQVATYRNNEITPADYSDVIHKIATLYNNAYVLCEINDIGEQVGTDLMENKEYEMVICSKGNGRAGKAFSLGGVKVDKGLRTTIASKKSGCLLLKLLIEQDKLKINDAWTLNELLTFVKQKNNSYAAEEGKHDDMVMTLVLFAYFSDSKFFEELVEQNTISTISERNLDDMVKNLLPFGYIQQQVIDEKDWMFRIGKQDYKEMFLPWNNGFQTSNVEVLTLPNF